MNTFFRGACLFLPLFFSFQHSAAQMAENLVVPTVVTNHYDKSEPLSHGVVQVMRKAKKVKVEVKDLAANAAYAVVLLNERTGERVDVGLFQTDKRGFSSKEFDVKEYLENYNALLVMNDEDVIQYAQLHNATHGCICKHSGGSIVTRRLDQECYECPCGVYYEICCGGKKH